MPRENTGLQYSRSRSQQELIYITVCEDIYWTDELLAMMSGDASPSVWVACAENCLVIFKVKARAFFFFFNDRFYCIFLDCWSFCNQTFSVVLDKVTTKVFNLTNRRLFCQWTWCVVLISPWAALSLLLCCFQGWGHSEGCCNQNIFWAYLLKCWSSCNES